MVFIEYVLFHHDHDHDLNFDLIAEGCLTLAETTTFPAFSKTKLFHADFQDQNV